MTNKDAIKILQLMSLDIRYPKGIFKEELSKEESDKSLALVKAISALEKQQNTEDNC